MLATCGDFMLTTRSLKVPYNLEYDKKTITVTINLFENRYKVLNVYLCLKIDLNDYL